MHQAYGWHWVVVTSSDTVFAWQADVGVGINVGNNAATDILSHAMSDGMVILTPSPAAILLLVSGSDSDGLYI